MNTHYTTCGIMYSYNTAYKLIAHRDGSYSVKTPYIKWVGGTGTLAFKTVKIIKFSYEIADAFNGDSDMTVEEIVSLNA